MNRVALLFALASASLSGSGVAEKKSAATTAALSLDRAVQTALKQNPDILRALHEIERTRGQVIEVRAEALPRVRATGNYRQEDKDFIEGRRGGAFSFGAGAPASDPADLFNNQGGGDKTWRIAMEVRQVLYSGGQVGAAIKIAKFTEDQSYYMLRDTLDRVIARVRSQFYAVLLNRKLITVAEESIRLLEDELKDQRNRFDAGTVPRFNVLRAEVAVANARPDLIRSRNNALIAELELAKTMGLSASKSTTGKPAFEVMGELRAGKNPMSLQNALAMAKKRRPLLKAQKQTILSEEQQITVAAAGNKPHLEATGGWEFRNSRLTDDTSKEVNGWFFGVNGTWDVWDGGATGGKIAQAKARFDSAQTAYEDSVQQVDLEVQKAFARIQEAKELIASQDKVIEQAEEALRLSRERLAAGAGTQLDVLDAEVARTKARTTQQQALFEHNVAIAEFDRATGADTIYDNTFPDPHAEQARTRLREGGAPLRGE